MVVLQASDATSGAFNPVADVVSAAGGAGTWVARTTSISRFRYDAASGAALACVFDRVSVPWAGAALQMLLAPDPLFVLRPSPPVEATAGWSPVREESTMFMLFAHGVDAEPIAMGIAA